MIANTNNNLWYSLIPLMLFNSIFIVLLFIFIFTNKNRPKTAEIENRPASIILNKWCREGWFWATNPIVNFLVKLKISPNMITMFGMFVNVVAGVVFFNGIWGLGGWLVTLSGTCDIFDGRVARALNIESKRGAFFDASVDRYSESFPYIGLAAFFRNDPMFFVILLTLVGCMSIGYIKAKAETYGVACEVGMMQRPERVVWLAVPAIFTDIVRVLLYPIFPTSKPYLLIGALIFLCLGTNYTSYYVRIKHGLNQIKN